MLKRFKQYIWILLFQKLFTFWQRHGFHLTPNHYYQPIPDTANLSATLWEQPSACIGIDFNEQFQIRMLHDFTKNYSHEYNKFPKNKTQIPYEYYIDNEYFASVDGEVLYCMTRHFKPKKIFEIGSGNSTYLFAKAILENQKDDPHYACEFIAFEPYPNATLQQGLPGLSKLVTTKVQEVPLSEFDRLQSGDILFIDSSHVLKIASDVQYEYLEVLPRLSQGVLVHIHDIFLPAEYPKHWVVEQYRFWNEQYILQAFLAFNQTFEILWAGSYMHLKYPHELQAAFRSYTGDATWPKSVWLRRTKA